MILTTHAGSLPRPPALVEVLSRRFKGQPYDPAELEAETGRAVTGVVAAQKAAGVDVANDGEQGRESFFTYVQHRMSGFGGKSAAPRVWQDIADFPEYAAVMAARRAAQGVSLGRPPEAVGEVRYGTLDVFEQECARFEAAVADAGSPFRATFVTAPSPGIVATAMTNRHYPSFEEYLGAVAEALRVEYTGVIDRGHQLQIDAPDLAMDRHGYFATRPLEEFLAFVDAVVGAINQATAGLPAERIRLHVCWGNYGGPHTHDVPLAALLPGLYRARVGALVLSMANPRHEHEYRELARQPLPAGMGVAVGVIDVTTNYVEHPEVVADRLERVVEAVGDPDRVIACTDCGFDTAAGFGQVAGDVAWAKLAALRAGTDLANQRLVG